VRGTKEADLVGRLVDGVAGGNASIVVDTVGLRDTRVLLRSLAPETTNRFSNNSIAKCKEKEESRAYTGLQFLAYLKEEP